MKALYKGSFLITIALILTWVSFNSCKHEPDLYVNPDSVCFERDILPIFVSKCAMSGCHDAVSSVEGYNLTNYASITRRGIRPGNPSSSKLYEVMAEGEMPPRNSGSMTALQKAYIKAWITGGAKNGINCYVSCDSSVFTYSQSITKIMTACTGCHSGSNASAGIDLSNQAGVKVVAQNGRLLGSVQQLSGYIAMPPYGATKLTDCQIAQIRKWTAAGCPDN